ncbi:membrane protein of unknown function [Nitrospira sp. KM1]|uniref:hypothetical protein n=1 Tax=Nitrospira sp. KM1 TaxID=1936990 RepID=UPI0013A784F1|nr:hypothetical protein [Nitrospira sp. KM1]BCA56887.1 membrane protein of unknown function [Nitrospira sp. KM1]
MGEHIITDPVAQEYFREGTTELEKTQSADAVLRKAESFGRKDARDDVMQSAFYYLAAANFLETRDQARSSHAYHQAGCQLHRLEQFTQAGRAYSNAGHMGERAAHTAVDDPVRHDLQHFAVRSYSRANHCFAEAGELDWSETEYLNERNARVIWAKMQGRHPWAQLAWKATSNYGTSFSRWGLWVLGTIGIFSLLYEWFFRIHWLQPMEDMTVVHWIPVWSGIYYSVNVTAALGLVDHQPSNMISQGVVILNVLIGYILLGIGIGIIGKIIRTR